MALPPGVTPALALAVTTAVWVVAHRTEMNVTRAILGSGVGGVAVQFVGAAMFNPLGEALVPKWVTRLSVAVSAGLYVAFVTFSVWVVLRYDPEDLRGRGYDVAFVVALVAGVVFAVAAVATVVLVGSEL